MVFRFLILAGIGLAAAACTTAQTAAPSAAQHRAAQLATLLTGTAEAAPDRIFAAEAEMAALERALTAPLASQGDDGTPMRSTPAEPPPAPDLTGARSVMSAVHLASYRYREHADAGWAQLQADAPGLLSGLQPRLSEADLGERGVFLRLKAGPLDSPQAAADLCGALQAAGQWCAPADYSGEQLTALR